jgi:DNA-binding response OmpR family regulator
MRILVVEDEPRMAELLQRGLTEEGHTVVLSLDGREGLSIAESEPFDLLLLDVMLPGTDGFSIVRRLRTRRNQTPILMLTARDATRDVVEGLNLGADDYLTKPFSFDELFARVRAAGRRGPATQAASLRMSDLTLDPGTREVWRGSRQITLTRTEFALLESLMRHAGRVVSRDTLIETVWGGQSDIESNTLDVFMRLLRAKVEIAGEPKLVQTIRGVGFCIRAGEK